MQILTSFCEYFHFDFSLVLNHFFLFLNFFLANTNLLTYFQEKVICQIRKYQHLTIVKAPWNSSPEGLGNTLIKQNQVSTGYINSAFLVYATPNHLYKRFIELLNDKLLTKFIQVSVDCPNVNLKFPDQMRYVMDLRDLRQLDCILLMVHSKMVPNLLNGR